jgi:hypothetical protein
MANSERLTPLPHLIKSIRNRHWSLSGALMEWVDNSLQHGKATNITIVIDNSFGIGIEDDGIGIDDINRVFTLGDASAYGDLSQIGQYGVGATDAMIFLGRRSQVRTIRDGRAHSKDVDWIKTEESGLWPLRYNGQGSRPKKGEVGTYIVASGLFQHYQLKTSESIAKDLGLTFSPALRNGAKISVFHKLGNGTKQKLNVEPYLPNDLTDLMLISGKVDTPRGVLKWKGRAGLSPSLVERHNGVHIAFAHRVIEMTRDAFMGISAPTLYAEVQLDDTTPWKYQLSDHKEKVIRFRDELMKSIYDVIKPLLDKSKEQATNLALLELTAQIQAPINKALKGAGLLHCNPDEDALEGGLAEGDGPGPGPDPDSKQSIHNPADAGEQAKEIKHPTGIKIDYVEKARLDGRAFAWDIEDRLMTIKLEKEMFTDVLGWPPRLRDKHVVHIVVSFLCHAIDMMYWDDTAHLRKAVTKKLFSQIEEWATKPEKIAPYLYNEVIGGVVLQ